MEKSTKDYSGYLKPTKGEVLLDGKPLPQKGISPVQLIYQHPEVTINPRWKMKSFRSLECFVKKLWRHWGLRRIGWRGIPESFPVENFRDFVLLVLRFPYTFSFLADEMSTMLDVCTQAQIWNLMLREVEERKIGTFNGYS